MGTKLEAMMTKSPDEFTLTDEYNAYIDSLAGMLRNDATTREIMIEPEIGYLYKFDLTGFLLANNVPLEDHRLVMRINGKTSAHDIDEYLTSLLIPDQGRVAALKQIYRTKSAVV